MELKGRITSSLLLMHTYINLGDLFEISKMFRELKQKFHHLSSRVRMHIAGLSPVQLRSPAALYCAQQQWGKGTRRAALRGRRAGMPRAALPWAHNEH